MPPRARSPRRGPWWRCCGGSRSRNRGVGRRRSELLEGAGLAPRGVWLPELFAVGELGEAGGEGEGQFGGGELAGGFEEGGAAFVALAEDAGAGGAVVEGVADLLLDDRGFFLDDEDFGEAFGEAGDGSGVERPDEGELEEADALGDAQFGEGLAGVVEGFAGGDDTEGGAGESTMVRSRWLARA